jgi:hypothetical protein
MAGTCDVGRDRTDLLGGKLEHEIFGKTLTVAVNLLVEAFGGYPIEGSKLCIEQHAMAARDEDGAGDVLRRDQGFSACHGGISDVPVGERYRASP